MKLYTNSTQSWSATLRAITKATKSIYIEMYIFSDDTSTTHDFVSALINRAQAGVQIVMILDAFGSIGLSNKTTNSLKEAGVEVRFFRHWIHRTHRKTIIVDGKRALVGGVNITRHAQNWNDLQIQVSGPIVSRLLKVFTRTYKLSGGTQKLLVLPKYLKRQHKIRSWILEHTPLSNQLTLRAYYTKKLSEAKEQITFITPYFIPHRWLLDAMRDAVSRGITVELLIPQTTDLRIIDRINQYYASRALDEGVHLYITTGTNHAKAVLIDNKEGLIGSANIDSLSFDRNSELGIFFTDEATVRTLANIVSHWKQCGKLISKSSPYRLPWYYFPFVFIVKIIHPFV
jgi:cardiolipin synthase